MLAVKIGIFYGTPVAAVLLGGVYFAVLLIRVRRGVISRGKAALRYAGVLLLPFATLAIVWAAAELTGYLALPAEGRTWDAAAAVKTLTDLLPIAAYVGAPIAALAVLFWSLLAFSKAT